MNLFFAEAITEGDALHDVVACYAGEGRERLEALGRAFCEGGYRRVAFAGMGSSYCAPFAVLDRLAARGISAIAPTAQKLARDRATLVTPDTMVVAISKSGATREILELTKDMSDTRRLVALVNQTDSVLAQQCRIVLPMCAGTEKQIASKSFLCTLGVQNMLVAALTGGSLDAELGALRDIADWARGCLAIAADSTRSALGAMSDCTHVDVLACGASFATAYKSALVIREVPRVIASAIDCADYAHGWAKVARPGYVAIILAPAYRESSVEARAAAQVLERGGRVVVITDSDVPQSGGLVVLHHPPVAEHCAPLVQAVVCDALIGAMTERG